MSVVELDVDNLTLLIIKVKIQMLISMSGVHGGVSPYPWLVERKGFCS